MFLLCILFLTVVGSGQVSDLFIPAPDPATQTRLWQELMVHDSEWFASDEAQRIAERVLLCQRASGGWPKNIDLKKPLNAARRRELEESLNEPLSTIDNGAT